MNPKTVSNLLKLTEIKMARDMASMGEIRQRQQARREERKSLSETARTEFPSIETLGGEDLLAYGKWSKWSDIRRLTLDADDASDAPELEAARKKLTRSFGETRALSDMHEAALRAEKERKAKLAERSGLPRED